jgi:hypothetical protein
VVLAGVETLHGIARTIWLAPALGKARALKLSIVSGSVLAFGVCLLLVPGIGLRGPGAHLGLGLGLAGFMALFDLALGRWVPPPLVPGPGRLRPAHRQPVGVRPGPAGGLSPGSVLAAAAGRAAPRPMRADTGRGLAMLAAPCLP